MNNLLLILAFAYLWFSFRELIQHLWKTAKESTGSVLAKAIAVLREIISNATGCGKCATFWGGLAASFVLGFPFVVAVAASAIYDLYERIKLRYL
jgi:hypothetical protein